MEITSNPEGSQLLLTLPGSSSQPEEHREFLSPSQSQPNVKKGKASNFPAKSIKIGSWKRISKNEGDIVVKFYFAKKIIVWEFLEEYLKSKIEVHWSKISAIKVFTEKDGIGHLRIELDQPPQYYKEIPPQPQKHSRWTKSIDFTDGRAALYRRHVAEFASGVLDKHYERLLQSDDRLLRLSQLYPSTNNSPFFTSIPNPQPHMLGMMVQYSNERAITHSNRNERGHNWSQDGPSTSTGELDQLLQENGMGSHILTQPLGSYISMQGQDHLMMHHGTDSHNPNPQLRPHIPTREQNDLILYHGNKSHSAIQQSGLCVPMGVQKNLVKYNETVSFYPVQQSGPNMNEEQDHTMMHHETESHYPIQQSDCIPIRVQDNLTSYIGTESRNPVQEFGSHITMGIQTSPTTYNVTNSCIPIQASPVFIPLEEENNLIMYNGAELYNPSSRASNLIMNPSSLDPNQGNQSYNNLVMLESDWRNQLYNNTNMELPRLEPDLGNEYKVVRL